MPKRAKIHVPPEETAVFSDLSKMSAAEVDALVDALASARPALTPAQLLAQISAVPGLTNFNGLSRIVRMLVGVSGSVYSRRLSIDNVVDDLIEQAKKESLLTFAEGTEEELRSRLREMFAVRTVEIMGKAAMIMTSHRSVFDSATIITEMRPIFTGGDQLEIAAGVIIHELQIEVYAKGGMETVYVALDSNDLDLLRAQVDRAIRKGVVLKAFEEKAGTVIIDE